MKRVLKWTAAVVATVAVAAFLAFLYFIPPFLTAAPETFSKPVADAPPQVTGIADPGERAIAEHGRYLVTAAGCIGCHATNGPQGPDYSKYLAGGALKSRHAGRHVRQQKPHAGQGDGPREEKRR